MKPDQLLRAILPEVLIDNFDIEGFEKSDTRFDIWLDEKKEQLREDNYNKNIISYGFGDYRTIQDYPIRGSPSYREVLYGMIIPKAIRYYRLVFLVLSELNFLFVKPDVKTCVGLLKMIDIKIIN